MFARCDVATSSSGVWRLRGLARGLTQTKPARQAEHAPSNIIRLVTASITEMELIPLRRREWRIMKRGNIGSVLLLLKPEAMLDSNSKDPAVQVPPADEADEQPGVPQLSPNVVLVFSKHSFCVLFSFLSRRKWIQMAIKSQMGAEYCGSRLEVVKL
ncbi:unnamed protein product [Tetraodon nigroviridis]|uniref:(spotted green pufferfish) hypothetical protein n=1 Tax=Tetraodon nigroviridis TaxID=99883 RepID=Q4S2A1_TETNG|nr:unnamed protein product [Tetraodon nigroviridis]